MTPLSEADEREARHRAFLKRIEPLLEEAAERAFQSYYDETMKNGNVLLPRKAT